MAGLLIFILANHVAKSVQFMLKWTMAVGSNPLMAYVPIGRIVIGKRQTNLQYRIKVIRSLSSHAILKLNLADHKRIFIQTTLQWTRYHSHYITSRRVEISDFMMSYRWHKGQSNSLWKEEKNTPLFSAQWSAKFKVEASKQSFLLKTCYDPMHDDR